jgi:hypothetical protein
MSIGTRHRNCLLLLMLFFGMGTSLRIFLKFKFLSICENWRFNISFSAPPFDSLSFHAFRKIYFLLFIIFYFYFYSILWCSSHTGSHHPQEEFSQIWLQVTEQSGKLQENLTNYILATSWRTYFLNLGNLRIFFPGNMANLARIFIQKNLLYESHWNFIWHKSDENLLSPGRRWPIGLEWIEGSPRWRDSYKAYK